jgi:hypothetical protein
MRRAHPASAGAERPGTRGVRAPDGGRPCTRCGRPTRRMQELFDGRRVNLCPGCWDAVFTPEQQARIEAAIAARRAARDT